MVALTGFRGRSQPPRSGGANLTWKAALARKISRFPRQRKVVRSLLPASVVAPSPCAAAGCGVGWGSRWGGPESPGVCGWVGCGWDSGRGRRPAPLSSAARRDLCVVAACAAAGRGLSLACGGALPYAAALFFRGAKV